jgi:hypothetical protein
MNIQLRIAQNVKISFDRSGGAGERESGGFSHCELNNMRSNPLLFHAESAEVFVVRSIGSPPRE